MVTAGIIARRPKFLGAHEDSVLRRHTFFSRYFPLQTVFIMGKRPSQGPDAGGKARKRLKVVHEAPTHEAITTTRQLKGLLAFDQDLKKARHGMLGN